MHAYSVNGTFYFNLLFYFNFIRILLAKLFAFAKLKSSFSSHKPLLIQWKSHKIVIHNALLYYTINFILRRKVLAKIGNVYLEIEINVNVFISI